MDKIKWTEDTCPPIPEGYPRYRSWCSLVWGTRESRLGRSLVDVKSNVPKELRRHKWLPTHITFETADRKHSLTFNPDEGDYVPVETLLWIKKYDPMLKKVARGI